MSVIFFPTSTFCNIISPHLSREGDLLSNGFINEGYLDGYRSLLRSLRLRGKSGRVLAVELKAAREKRKGSGVSVEERSSGVR